MASINASTSGAGGVITTADNTGNLELQSGGSAIATVSSTGLSLATGKTLSVGGAVGSPFSLKNRIINGDMVISQRNGTSSVTPTTTGYYIDRWYLDTYGGGFNSLTMQQLSASPPTGFRNYLQIASGSTTYTNINISQSIETANCYDLAGQTVTLSFWYKVPVNWTNQWIASVSYQTTADTKIAGGTGTTAGSLTLSNTSTWTKASITCTIPSNAQTIGVIFNNGNNNIINGSQFQITGVQLEQGSSATSYEWLPISTELALCQRYFQSNGASGGNNTITVGQATGAGTATSAYVLPVVMRTTPSLTIPAGATFGFITSNAGANAGGTITIAASSNNQVINFGLASGSGLTAGNATALVVSYHGYQLSAEL